MGEQDGARKYNGWANYETWAVKLWLDNEASSHFYWTETARDWHGLDGAASGFARRLQEEVADAMPLREASLYSDLLRAALGEVDWFEIAESYLEEVEADDEDTDSTGDGDSCDGRPSPQPTEHRPLEAGELFGGLAFAYTRQQALADGVLVDVTEQAREAGFKVPAAVTRAVWTNFVEAPSGVECQDEAGRLWDVLWMCRFFAGRPGNRKASEFRFRLHVRNDDRPGEPPLVTLKAVCGPDDERRPCLTIMTPEED